MKHPLPLLLILLLFIAPPSFSAPKADKGKAKPVATTPFDYHKGINISTWLSHVHSKPGKQRREYFTRADFQQLVDMGFDHFRLPVDEKQLFDVNGARIEETFELIHNAINWCKETSTRIILDFHMFREKESYIWTHPKEQERLIGLWKKLSAEFGKYPNTLLAYEIFNEPRVPDDQLWNEWSTRLINTLRKKEPERIIFLASNRTNSVSTFGSLTFPPNDPNIILSFHFYYPYLLTHYKANFFSRLKDIDIEITYPGRIISDSVRQSITDEEWRKIEAYQGVYDRETLLKRILPAIEKARASGLRIHCGEFGCNFLYPDWDLQYRWTQDMVSIFREYDIPYTWWGYRASFGIFDNNRRIKDQRIVDVLTK